MALSISIFSFQDCPYQYRYQYFSKVSIYQQSIFDIDISNRARLSDHNISLTNKMHFELLSHLFLDLTSLAYIHLDYKEVKFFCMNYLTYSQHLVEACLVWNHTPFPNPRLLQLGSLTNLRRQILGTRDWSTSAPQPLVPEMGHQPSQAEVQQFPCLPTNKEEPSKYENCEKDKTFNYKTVIYRVHSKAKEGSWWLVGQALIS